MSLATATLPPELEAYVSALVDEDTRELAKPPRIEMTQYGHYMGVLAKLPAIPGLSPAASVGLWGIVLARSGGNVQGITDAVRASS